MPTYEYACSNCGHTFEIMQSMKEEKLKKCPDCGEEKLQRLIGSGAGLIFKGSGFYLTDYAKKESSSTDVSKKESKSEPAAAKEKKETKESTPVSTDSKSKSAESTKPAEDSKKK